MSGAFVPALPGETPIVDLESRFVLAYVCLAEDGEARGDVTARAVAFACEVHAYVCVYDADQTFIGTAYAY